MKNRVTAGLLSIFLGGFGIHHFYLGNTGLGILYLLTCWTFIPAIISFIEGLIYFTKSDEEFNAEYNGKIKSQGLSESENLDRLQKLYDLKTKGVISEEEFQKEKEKMKYVPEEILF